MSYDSDSEAGTPWQRIPTDTFWQFEIISSTDEITNQNTPLSEYPYFMGTLIYIYISYPNNPPKQFYSHHNDSDSTSQPIFIGGLSTENLVNGLHHSRVFDSSVIAQSIFVSQPTLVIAPNTTVQSTKSNSTHGPWS